jgi:hypothetical protein
MVSDSGDTPASLEHKMPPEVEPGSSIIEPIQLVDDNIPTEAYSSLTVDRVPEIARLRTTDNLFKRPEGPDFPSLNLFSAQYLVCPINVDAISNRWLYSYIPTPGQKNKTYPVSIVALIHKILKSYTALTVRGRGVPPFVHVSQTMAESIKQPLSTCLTLVRMCEKPLPGSESAAVDVLYREMNSLYEKQESYDDIAHLAAFQAYLIYTIVLFFRLEQGSAPILRQAIMHLQGLACSSCRRGLMCIAEQEGARPQWENWVIVEAKRRTLFTMYLFDSMLSAQDGLPTLLGTELEGLPAPASRFLWRASTRQQWVTAYNIHLTDWEEGGFRIDELWPIPAGLDEFGLLQRRNRVDQWLEGVDEFGTMLFAVTSCTHGS